MTRSRSPPSGIALGYVVGDLDAGVALIDRALALNPNLASAWFFSGWSRIWRGEPDVAIEHIARAMRLSPPDPHIFGCTAAWHATPRGPQHRGHVLGGKGDARAT